MRFIFPLKSYARNTICFSTFFNVDLSHSILEFLFQLYSRILGTGALIAALDFLTPLKKVQHIQAEINSLK